MSMESAIATQVDVIDAETYTGEPETLPKEYKFKCMHIRHRYAENTPSRHRKYETIEEMIPDLENPETCSYECLDKEIRRIYLDLECLETDDHRDILNGIIAEFQAFIGHPDLPFHVTYNAGSKGHPGASYHVVFDKNASYILLKNIIIAFKKMHDQWTRYIDESVYSVFRLFRLPNQCKQRDQDVPDPEDVHKIETASLISDFVIQNTEPYTTLTIADLSDETVRQIGLVALNSKRPVKETGKSGAYAKKEVVEQIGVAITEIKDSTESMQRQIAELKETNARLVEALTTLLAKKNNE